jgi:hypothetical protein
LGEKLVANRRYVVIYLQTTAREWESSYAAVLGGFPLKTPPIGIRPVQNE